MQTQSETSLPLIDELVRCYYGAVVRLAQAILNGSADEAEDAAQEVFIAAARGLDSYRGEASPKTWLFRIAINHCRRKLQQQRTRLALVNALGSALRLFGHEQSPEERAEVSERDRSLWAAVDALDEKHRLVIILRYVQELPVTEIAQMLEVNEGTVHSRLHYARSQLARQIRPYSEIEEAAWR